MLYEVISFEISFIILSIFSKVKTLIGLNGWKEYFVSEIPMGKLNKVL